MTKQIRYILIALLTTSTMLYASATKIIDSISIYHNLSQYNFKIHNYKEAIYFENKSLIYSQTIKNTEAQIERNFVLGKLYFDLGKYNEAQNYFEQSFRLNTNNPPNFNKFKAIYFAGYCAISKKNWSKASLTFAKADHLLVTPALKKKVNLLLLKKGKLYFKKKQYDIAIITFDRLLANSDPATEKNNIEEAYLFKGIIALQNKNYPDALALLEKALVLNKTTKNLKNKENTLLQLSKCYKAMRDFDQAYSYLEEYHLIKVHLAEIISAKQNQEKFKQFKRDEEYKALVKKNKELQQAETNNKYSKLINIIAIALITILSFLSLSLYKNNIIRSESNRLLREKNQELIIAKKNAEKASKARSEFLSTVSHELRTPLNAINGITHLLLEENPKESQLNYLASLQFSGNYLTNFINQILEINKIDSNKIEMENNSFHLKELLVNIQNALKKFALTNNNELNLEFDNTIPNYIIGDPTKLSQVFLNLISNALKFTNNGTVTIAAKLIKIKEDNVKINFKIIDTGIGIPKDKLKLVFENFSQGSVEINRKYGGTGLGLTIVKKLVKVLGGKIKLESEEGKGSTFSFCLVFKIAKSLEDTSKKAINYNEEQFRNKKILLVEDNKINQMITKKMLENKGIVCIIIDNGEDAVKLMHNHNYDLVLMDIHLPGINGTEATKQIREFDDTVPIIAMTAISLDENRETLLSYGMNDVITKPFIPEEFYTIISKYIAS